METNTLRGPEHYNKYILKVSSRKNIHVGALTRGGLFKGHFGCAFESSVNLSTKWYLQSVKIPTLSPITAHSNGQ